MAGLGARLLESAEQALAIAEGKARHARLHENGTPDVAGILMRKKLSPGPFVECYRLSVASVRDREQTKT